MHSRGRKGEVGGWLPARAQSQVQNVSQRGVLPPLPRGGHQLIRNIHSPRTRYCCEATFHPYTNLRCFLQSCPQLLLVSLPVENNPAPNRRRGLCQLNGMCCTPQITRTCSALTIQPPSLFHPLSHCMLDGDTQRALWLICAVTV